MTPALRASAVAIPGRLDPTDLTASFGEFIALIGPNGGGKTSLLRALARVDGATGNVMLDREPLDAMAINRRRKILAYLPASHDAAWPVPVGDYISLSGATSDESHRWLVEFDLEPMAGRPIDQLSTGERSRVMLARALANSPRLLLLDEPLSNLEPFWVLRLLDMLQREAARGAIVMVSLHDLHQLERFDRALMIGNGAVVADGAPTAVTADAKFEALFRVALIDRRLELSRTADPRSSR